MDKLTDKRLPTDLLEEILNRSYYIRQALELPRLELWSGSLEELQLNAILERNMDVINHLNEKIDILTFRPPDISDGLNDRRKLFESILAQTRRIRQELDRPRLELWDGNLMTVNDNGVRVKKTKITRDHNKSGWSIHKRYSCRPDSLNLMIAEHSPGEIYDHALRNFSDDELDQSLRVDNIEEMKKLHINAILERSMDEIDRLSEKADELEFRAPEIGGASFLATKRHWEGIVFGEQS